MDAIDSADSALGGGQQLDDSLSPTSTYQYEIVDIETVDGDSAHYSMPIGCCLHRHRISSSSGLAHQQQQQQQHQHQPDRPATSAATTTAAEQELQEADDASACRVCPASTCSDSGLDESHESQGSCCAGCVRAFSADNNNNNNNNKYNVNACLLAGHMDGPTVDYSVYSALPLYKQPHCRPECLYNSPAGAGNNCHHLHHQHQHQARQPDNQHDEQDCSIGKIDTDNQENGTVNGNNVQLVVNIKLKKKKHKVLNSICPSICSSTDNKTIIPNNISSGRECLSLNTKMFSFLRKDKSACNNCIVYGSKHYLFPIILILSIIALVLLHNGSLRTRRTPSPTDFFIPENPFITEFKYGQLNELWSRITQNEVSFIMYYAPWDSDCIRSRNEIEIVANHYGQQIFFAAINCWWPDGECRKYQSIQRYPRFVAHIRIGGEIEYKGPILASYIIPFLDNVMNPVIPILNEGEILDLRSEHDAVLLGYFDFNQSPHPPGYRAYLTAAIKALETDPWRNVVFTVVTNLRVALKLKLDLNKDSPLILYVANSTEHFSAKFMNSATILSWAYSRADHSFTLKWINPSGIKSAQISNQMQKKSTFILFTPRSFILGISPYFDLLREIVLDYYNCDNSPIIRSLVHRNILRRRLLEDKLSELEERCHELLDEAETLSEGDKFKRFTDNEDTCCHSQTVKWRSYGSARRGMAKKCLCTSCVHISLPKCPARCTHFDCLGTAARFLDDFDPNSVNTSAVYCNQIKSVYEPKYTSYYKISTSCSGTLSPINSKEDNNQWYDVDEYSNLSTDEKITRMIQDFEIQHCRRLKLGMNYTDLNFPDSSESRNSKNSNWRANFTGLSCRTNRTLNFFALDSTLYPGFAESLGIDVFNVPHSTVALIIDSSNENVHVLNHDILFQEVELPAGHDSKSVLNVPTNSYSKKIFTEFIKNFTDGTLPRFLRSKFISSSSGLCDLKQMVTSNTLNDTGIICVPELNSISFTNFVLAKPVKNLEPNLKKNKPDFDLKSKSINKDILVMYYAPWCGFCTSIAHIYLDVARFFSRSNDIIFTRINGDANDLPWEYMVDRYPTLMFFPARKRSNSVTYPANKAVTKFGLLEFILKHSQSSVKIQTMLSFCKQNCIERTLLSIHPYKRAISRSIRHNLNSLMSFKYQLEKINNKIGLTKDLDKLKNRQIKVDTHIKYIQFVLRKLCRIRNRQSLLSYFILKRIDQLKKLYQLQESDLDENAFQLGDEMYRLFYNKMKPNPNKTENSTKVSRQAPKQIAKKSAASTKSKSAIKSNTKMKEEL